MTLAAAGAADLRETLALLGFPWLSRAAPGVEARVAKADFADRARKISAKP